MKELVLGKQHAQALQWALNAAKPEGPTRRMRVFAPGCFEFVDHHRVHRVELINGFFFACRHLQCRAAGEEKYLLL